MRPNSTFSTTRAATAWRAIFLVAICCTTVAMAALTAQRNSEARHQATSVDPAAPGDVLPPLPPMKHPVDSPAALREGYEFVARHPDVARYMPCFCACGRDKTHSSIEDCFIKSRGATPADLAWSSHGGECMICVAVAAEARRLFIEGRSVPAIRAEIERTLAPKFKFHTDTPLPPQQ